MRERERLAWLGSPVLPTPHSDLSHPYSHVSSLPVCPLCLLRFCPWLSVSLSLSLLLALSLSLPYFVLCLCLCGTYSLCGSLSFFISEMNKVHINGSLPPRHSSIPNTETIQLEISQRPPCPTTRTTRASVSYPGSLSTCLPPP